MSLLAILLVICAFGLIFWAFQSYVPVPQPFKNICLFIIVIFCALFLLNVAGVVSFGTIHV